ncbi:MAG: hypothetical protein BWY77_00622 [bacterium ADurb.Bin431]|nr:MAG: hypothetical protein BWY77_00622 [bacterium ADurb.Bin431]
MQQKNAEYAGRGGNPRGGVEAHNLLGFLLIHAYLLKMHPGFPRLQQWHFFETTTPGITRLHLRELQENEDPSGIRPDYSDVVFSPAGLGGTAPPHPGHGRLDLRGEADRTYPAAGAGRRALVAGAPHGRKRQRRRLHLSPVRGARPSRLCRAGYLQPAGAARLYHQGAEQCHRNHPRVEPARAGLYHRRPSRLFREQNGQRDLEQRVGDHARPRRGRQRHRGGGPA